jgi:hypothetical protein
MAAAILSKRNERNHENEKRRSAEKMKRQPKRHHIEAHSQLAAQWQYCGHGEKYIASERLCVTVVRE